MQILEPILWITFGLAIYAGMWLGISRLIARGRRKFFWINFAIAGVMVGWILEINYLEAPSASMMISIPLTFEFFHICLGIIIGLIIRYLQRRDFAPQKRKVGSPAA